MRRAHPKIKPQLGERNRERIFGMTERATRARIVRLRENSGIKKRIARFDLPIQQSVPAERVFERDEEDRHQLERKQNGEDPFNATIQSRQRKLNLSSQFDSPACDCNSNSERSDEPLQCKTGENHSSTPQTQ